MRVPLLAGAREEYILEPAHLGPRSFVRRFVSSTPRFRLGFGRTFPFVFHAGSRSALTVDLFRSGIGTSKFKPV